MQGYRMFLRPILRQTLKAAYIYSHHHQGAKLACIDVSNLNYHKFSHNVKVILKCDITQMRYKPFENGV